MHETVIQSLSAQGIRDGLREALLGATPVPAVCDFVAGVDWSGMDTADGEVRCLLGELEQLTTEVAEGDLDAPAFLERIKQIESAAIASPPGT